MGENDQEKWANDRMKTLRDVLGKMGPQLAAALPKHISQERFLRVMLTTVRKDRTGKLLSCTITSILGAMMQAAQDGLELDGVHAALVPYKDHGQLEAHAQKMYRGMIAMARRSGDVSGVRSRPVYEGDVFEYEDGLNPILRHVRGEEEDDAKIKAFYCIVELKDGHKQFEVMTRRQIEKIRDGSKAYQFDKEESTWTTNFPEMGCKTVAIRALKWSPMAAEDQRSITREELSERGQAPALTDFELPALPEGMTLDQMPVEVTQPGKGKAMAEEVRARTQAQRKAHVDTNPTIAPGVTVNNKQPGPGDKAGPVPATPPAGDDQGRIPGV